MNSYIDKTTREDFTEDAAIRKAIDNIYDMLAELPKEERLAFFKQISKPKNLDFVKEVDGIYYVVCSHFDRGQREDMITKVNRILSTEV
ncbi:hypothetical protein [Enterocloster clostridioformis]|uniref:Uncharacterized protein n=1 Tax=Enterocloster clostridioformis TaxID=1531 RepID=A0A2X2U5W9_9FIRM|nr:hypothetical protein [Enterocloster clostridioformis]MCA5578507.1 transposon-encoded TnpW family protein [Enterocloster clostridioformis]SQB11616.1 Uncharacterised protein [Enterocloster clostridioformis]